MPQNRSTVSPDGVPEGSVRPEQRNLAALLIRRVLGGPNKPPEDQPELSLPEFYGGRYRRSYDGKMPKVHLGGPYGTKEAKESADPEGLGELAVMLTQRQHPKLWDTVGALSIYNKPQDPRERITGLMGAIEPSIFGSRPIMKLMTGAPDWKDINTVKTKEGKEYGEFGYSKPASLSGLLDVIRHELAHVAGAAHESEKHPSRKTKFTTYDVDDASRVLNSDVWLDPRKH